MSRKPTFALDEVGTAELRLRHAPDAYVCVTQKT